MTDRAAIVVAALLIAGAIIGAQFIPRYQIAAATDAAGNAFAWRLDIHTGDVEACTFVKNPFAQIGDPNRTGMFVECHKELPK